MPKYTFCLLSVDYTVVEGQPVVRMFGRTDKGKSIVAFDKAVEPYFYALLAGGFEEVKKRLEDMEKKDFHIEKIEKVRKFYKTEEVELMKIFTRIPGEVPAAREKVRHAEGVKEIFEADILFGWRYIIDKEISPMSMVEVEGEEVESDLDVEIAVETKGKPKQVDEPLPKLRVASFDIEAYSTGGLPQAETDPIIMISLATDSEKKVISTKEGPGYVEVVKDEKAIIEAFEKFVRGKDIDILTAYNSDNFDMPYIRDRCKKLGIKFKLGRDKREVYFKSRGRFHAAGMTGRVHVDLFHYVSIILRGALGQVNKRTLKSVAANFLDGVGKKEIDWKEVDKYWKGDKKHLNELYDYSVTDAVVTQKLAELFLPREYEISRLVRVQLFDSVRTTYGRLVEAYLMWNAHERNELIPNSPRDEEREARGNIEAFEGAFVLEPEKGMHENIALFDFRSLYPTIIISHNIDQSTIDCDCCKGKEKPVGDTAHWFCRKRNGLMPVVLKTILEQRIKMKGGMKKHKKGTKEYERLDNTQYALKILANSAYGYLAYRGSRWYTREGASTVTALGRMYIKKIIGIAEKDFGLKAIYGDTDSLFVISEKGKVEEAAPNFLKKVNSELPGVMELEFEGTFRRGVFVSKKRYAMIDDEGELKIKGLEFVRKDWSPIAKETQKKVIETLLKEGDPEKAFKIVRDVVKKIKEGKVTIDDLAVYTDLTRPLEKYQVTAPHIAVAGRLKREGADIHTGSTIGYVIRTGGGLISERARPVEGFDIKNVDKTYYIEHQIVPAVSRVMESLGYGKEELLGKKQKTLEGF